MNVCDFVRLRVVGVTLANFTYTTLAGLLTGLVPVNGPTLVPQTTYMGIPSDWELAPLNDESQTLASMYSWSSEVLYVNNTKLYTYPHAQAGQQNDAFSSMLVSQSMYYKPGAGAPNARNILIRQ